MVQKLVSGIALPSLPPKYHCKNVQISLGYPPLRIDILNAISGVEIDEAYHNRVEGELDDSKVNFINVSEFIKNKEATGICEILLCIYNTIGIFVVNKQHYEV